VYHNDFNAVMTGAILGQASFPRTDTISVFDRLENNMPCGRLGKLSKQTSLQSSKFRSSIHI